MNRTAFRYAFLLYALFFVDCLNAQSPQGINYQAVLRDNESGEPIRNEVVFLIINIRDGGPAGELVYSETHPTAQTGEFGLINLLIGDGDVTSGSFENIPWSSGNIWYEIELDYGSGLQSLGSSQFLSVPYALYAGNAEPSLDNDPENELITSAIYDSASNSLILQQANGTELTVSLESLNINDADSDPSNELISPNNGLQLNGDQLTITEGTISHSVNLEDLRDDADPNPSNELIDDVGFTLTNDTILSLSEAGIVHSINLAPLRNDNDWETSEEENIIYNQEDRVGIGTNEPAARLDVIEPSNSQPALNLVSGDQTLLRASNERLAIGTESANSRVQFGGSIGYDFTLLSNEATDNYSVSAEDHMVIVNFLVGGNTEFNVFLPDASLCEGRVYYVRKTGVPGEIGDVIIDAGSFPIDFDDPDLVLSDNGPQTAVLLSLGNDGWTLLLRED